MNHSQGLSQTPLTAWVLAKSDGEILAAHCTCMAGNGEACSHVAALLFYMQYVARARQDRSCTDTDNSWLPPHIRKIHARPVSEMDFASSAMKKRQLEADMNTSSTVKLDTRQTAPAPTEEEWTCFLSSLIKAGHRPVVASTHPAFSDGFVPAVRSCKGADLRRLYDRSLELSNHQSVVSYCDDLYSNVTITTEAVKSIEARTRRQAMSTQWFEYRAGRVTASTLYDVCHTSTDTPSLSLIKRICYPHQNQVNAPQLKYGRQNEANALAKYQQLTKELHHDVEFHQAGLLISQEYVFLGATPDLLVKCSCCGEGTVEVKCPWTVRDGQLCDLLREKSSCVSECEGSLRLKKSHRYYYQIQVQLFVWKREYCDFVLWTCTEIHVERVKADKEFLLPLLHAAEGFFKTVLLPELVCRWFTTEKENQPPAQSLPSTSAAANVARGNQPPAPSQLSTSALANPAQPKCTANVTDASLGQYCVCRGPEKGRMIACDSPACAITWYHFKCVGLKKAPKASKWFCDSCRAQQSF